LTGKARTIYSQDIKPLLYGHPFSPTSLVLTLAKIWDLSFWQNISWAKNSM